MNLTATSQSLGHEPPSLWLVKGPFLTFPLGCRQNRDCSCVSSGNQRPPLCLVYVYLRLDPQLGTGGRGWGGVSCDTCFLFLLFNKVECALGLICSSTFVGNSPSNSFSCVSDFLLVFLHNCMCVKFSFSFIAWFFCASDFLLVLSSLSFQTASACHCCCIFSPQIESGTRNTYVASTQRWEGQNTVM